MRPLGVVVIDVDVEHAFEVATVEDQQPVEALGTYGSDEAFGDRVRLGRPDGCLHDPDPFAPEHLVERSGVLAVAVADQEAGSLEETGEAQIASLLGDPAAVRVGRATREPDATAGVLDEEQHVVATQEQCLDREEVAGDDARGLGMQELAPARPRASWRGTQPGSGEQAADARRRCLEAELGEFAADPPMPPSVGSRARAAARAPGSPVRLAAGPALHLAAATSVARATGASAGASAA
jgi:hypothetical protein